MASQLSTFNYQTKSGKMWGYRFEQASIEGTRKWISKRGFKTKSEALKEGRKAQEQYESKGFVVEVADMSYSDFLDTWINSLKGILKDTTVDNYIKKSKLYLKPYLGSRRLSTITKDDIRTLMQTLKTSGRAASDGGLSRNTLSIIQGMIQKSFSFAVDEHMLQYSPISGKFPTPYTDPHSKEEIQKTKPHVFIPKEMIDKIFKRFPEGSTCYIPMMLGYKCGLRIGEAFALTWDDVDLTRGFISVNKQVQWKRDISTPPHVLEGKSRRNKRHESNVYGTWLFSNTKYNSDRIVKIDDDLISLLTRIKETQDKNIDLYKDLYFNYYEADDGVITKYDGVGKPRIRFVNTREDGEFVSPRVMLHASRVIHKDLGYPEFDFHSLRHTHATMLAENGASPMFVQHRLGHKNMDVTLRVYYHYTEKMDNDGSDIIAKMFNI